MIESDDYWRGHGDALTQVGVKVAEKLGDTPADQATISMADLGAIILEVRALADAKPGMNEPE